MNEEYLRRQGAIDDICTYLIQNGIDNIKNAERIISFITKNKRVLDHTEFINIEKSSNSTGLTIPGYNFYINIRTTTIVLCALILDVNLTKGFAATFVSLSGLPASSLVKLNEYEGEKCILLETLALPNKTGNPDILHQLRGMCCNNDMKCKYRSEDNCLCKDSDVLSIYQNLTSKNVFRQNNAGFKYVW